MKTIYGLKTRMNDSESWSETTWYKTKKERDRVASINRVIGGFRTYSFEEKKTLEEINDIDF